MVASGLNSVINYELGNIGKDNKICHHAEGNVAGCVHEILSDVVLFHTTNDVPAMWEFGNPHLSRIASRVQSQQQAELLTMVQLLLPGTNSIYYGEEIGMLDLPPEQLTHNTVCYPFVFLPISYHLLIGALLADAAISLLLKFGLFIGQKIHTHKLVAYK
ncbi:unnamed protein product [Gongylonema pulchrum]|uniref:Glycosyl hydrolase family 13 catalytic domain-containing protein n=1 Tax=Gongylonema pulchrum TaxID=637853 RepID=A0A3P7NKE1_9BILA|nr:unnamed protein product [Gongylonema pulchrum]